MVAASTFPGSSRAPEIAGSSSSLPTLAESLRVLSALVTYLRTWVPSWAATQLLATKKMKAKQRTRNSMLPRSVSHGGRVRCSRRGRLGAPPEPGGLRRRADGANLWDLRSHNYHQL